MVRRARVLVLRGLGFLGTGGAGVQVVLRLKTPTGGYAV